MNELFACWVIFHYFLSSDFFHNQLFRKIFQGVAISMSNSLDPDQAQLLVRPNFGPNCLQRLSADKFLPKSSAKPLADLELYIDPIFKNQIKKCLLTNLYVYLIVKPND